MIATILYVLIIFVVLVYYRHKIDRMQRNYDGLLNSIIGKQVILTINNMKVKGKIIAQDDEYICVEYGSRQIEWIEKSKYFKVCKN